MEGVDVAGLQSYLAQTEVTFALLFGSHARGTATPTSDVDIALRFPDWLDGTTGTTLLDWRSWSVSERSKIPNRMTGFFH
ncbi:nucleotidyltransferase domain-containing protein [Haladaptatus sp. NG-WS-4]